MMRTSTRKQRLPFLILALLLHLHLPLLTAEVLRAQPLLPTIAPLPLFVRQAATCDVGQTACHDGSGGCCNIGALCTVNTNLVPICSQPCAIGEPKCTGILSGLCCSIGYTCNYQSTICISHGLNFFPAPITESDDASGTASVTAFSITETVTSPTTSIPVPPAMTAVPSPLPPIVPILPVTSVPEVSPSSSTASTTSATSTTAESSATSSESSTSPTTSIPVPPAITTVPSPLAPIVPILPVTSVPEVSPSSSTTSTTSATSTTAESSAISSESSTSTTPTSQPSAVEPITTAQPSVSILTATVTGGQRRLPSGVERLLVSCVLMLLLVL